MFRAHSPPSAVAATAIPGLHPAAGWEAGRIRVAAGREAGSRIDKQFVSPTRGSARRTARTGVLSSLPFSRSRSSCARPQLTRAARCQIASGGQGPVREAECNTSRRARGRDNPWSGENLDEVVRLLARAGAAGTDRAAGRSPPSPDVGVDRRRRWPRYPCAVERAPGVALRRRQSGARRAGRPGRRARPPAAGDDGTSRPTAVERRLRRGRRIAAEQHVGGLVGRPRRLGAVHQLGHLRRQRPLGRAARWGAAACSSSERLDAPRPGAARTSAGEPAISSSPICIQYWRNWYGLVLAGSSHTAPPSVLPSFDAVGCASSSGQANACTAAPASCADQVDAGDDVAPLVGAADLDLARRGARGATGSRWPAAACS